MCEKNLFEPPGRKLRHQCGGLVVRKMSPRPGNAPLERFCAVALAKHHRIVVGFQRRNIRTGKIAADGIKGGADIGAVEIRAFGGFDQIPDGIHRIVRRRKRRNAHTADLEALAVFEAYERRFVESGVACDLFRRHQIGVDRNVIALEEHAKPADMVGMIVRNDNRSHGIEIHSALHRAFAQLFAAKSAIDEQHFAAGDDRIGIALGTAGQRNYRHGTFPRSMYETIFPTASPSDFSSAMAF